MMMVALAASGRRRMDAIARRSAAASRARAMAGFGLGWDLGAGRLAREWICSVAVLVSFS